MKSKKILPEDERVIYRPIEDENPETVAYQNKDVWILLKALEAAEKEIVDLLQVMHTTVTALKVVEDIKSGDMEKAGNDILEGVKRIQNVQQGNYEL